MPSRFSTLTTARWCLLAGLMALCAVPALAGIARLVQLHDGGPINAENLRFFASPWPVVLHIVGSLVFSIGGAFQLIAPLRQGHPALHRRLGRVLVAFGLLSALSGLWMTQCYPPAQANFDGAVLHAIRWVVGCVMALMLVAAYRAAVQGRIAGHRQWMLRAYALGLGAGAQVLTHLPWALLPAWRGEGLRTACMAAGWLLNLAVAEWVIHRSARPSRPPRAGA